MFCYRGLIPSASPMFNIVRCTFGIVHEFADILL
jgi:hypothetical protein